MTLRYSGNFSILLFISILIDAILLFNVIPYPVHIIYAQTSPITSSGLNTQISAPTTLPNGQISYNITGGTRPGGGTNLFHSFGDFNVPTNNLANFLNETALPTSNILGRVTGGSISNIFGTIQTPTFGNANLFLINPAGIVFGPHTSLNVGGSVTFTTANYLRLTEVNGIGGIFHADPVAASVLTSAPVAAFGFLGSNPAPIMVQGSHLAVQPGQSISLVGGDIAIQAGTLANSTVQPSKFTAPGGQVNLVSVAGAGEVLASNFEPASTIALGSITLSQGSVVDVSADAAGTIRIRGGQFVISDGTLSADTIDTNGAQTAIDINVTGDMSIYDTRGVPALTARTTGTGNAGEIHIASGNLSASTTFVDQFLSPATFVIDSHTEGSGVGGNVTIRTGDLIVTNLAQPRTNFYTFIESGTRGSGRGGDVTITAGAISMDTTAISTGDSVARQFLLEPSGSAGNLTINANTLHLVGSILDTSAFAALAETQAAGDLTINANNINTTNTQIALTGVSRGGAVAISADTFVTDTTLLDTTTISGPGGGITVNARTVELTNSSSLISNTLGDGRAGDIRVTASDHVSLLGFGTEGSRPPSPSGLASNSFGGLGDHGGDAGNIIVTTPRLEMTIGRINTSTETSGHGGNVTINANQISMAGEFPNTDFPEPIFTITDIHPSGIFTKTVGNEFCFGPCGNAGNISITTGTLSMGNGSQIDSGTSTIGHGGEITINAANTISISGTLSNGSPVGIFSRTIGPTPDAGTGGNIALTAGQSVTISNGASVSASSSGPGNAGNISINAGQQFEMQNGSVKTEAAQASGGNIDIRTIDRIRLVNSAISTSVLGGAGSGGNISIDPTVVILQNSQILAQAVQGAGGNITITTPLFLADQTSLVSASSQFGLNGTVNIQSPTSNLSGTVSSLPSSMRQSQALQTGRCAALANSQSSSLIIAGRETLPTEPGGWLPSPLALLSEGPGLGVRGEGLSGLSRSSDPRHETNQIDQTDQALLSLRRLTPAGFLTQSFAESESTGCRS